MDMANPIWQFVIGQSPIVVVLALLVYYMFKYFNKVISDLNARWDEREKRWKEEIHEKDKRLEDIHEKVYELTKLAVETQTATMSKLNEFIREFKSHNQ